MTINTLNQQTNNVVPSKCLQMLDISKSHVFVLFYCNIKFAKKGIFVDNCLNKEETNMYNLEEGIS